MARFERELELARRIKSANVVGVVGYGVREGTPYLALEYIDGPSLRERLATHGPYSWQETKPLLSASTTTSLATTGAESLSPGRSRVSRRRGLDTNQQGPP